MVDYFNMKNKVELHGFDILRLMRPKHYIKNLLIFVSIAFDRNIFYIPVLWRGIGGFISFCLLSSAVYILNDIHDVEEDRQHEVKKTRPIASGRVSIPTAYLLGGGILFLAVIINYLTSENYAKSFLIMFLYFAVNLGYSLGLKNIPFLDIILLVTGFLLRVLYGAVIVNSIVSDWVYLTVISLSFYLGLGKRRNEMRKSSAVGSTRHVLSFYTYEFLDKFMYLCLTLAIAFYALWSADTEIIMKYGTNKLVWTVPFVIVLLMKYSADIESDSHGDPVDVITNDKSLLFLGAVYVLVLLSLIYVPWS